MMDLSHSVDDVAQRNLAGLKNVDLIQHTSSVEKTAHALFALTETGGDFVFNCYPLNDQGWVRWVRFHIIYKSLRAVLSRLPFRLILAYSRLMGFLHLIPGLGLLLEKSYFCVMGDVPRLDNEPAWSFAKRRFKSTVLNTFDCYGSHSFQHHKTDDKIRALVNALQTDTSKVFNMHKYFLRPAPICCALGVFR